MSQNNNVKILFVGDIIGSFGRAVLKSALPEIKEALSPDFIIVNGENSAHGYGITQKIYTELMDLGISAVSMGNHIWDKKDILNNIGFFENMVRPANYPKEVPGKEYLVIENYEGKKLGLLNLLGRVFMPPIDCPFKSAEEIIAKIKKETNVIFVDFHAEASSEKCAMGFFLDGKVSAVVGTHTHVMTNDDRIMPQGTAFLSDVGMTGPQNSIIGMRKDQILKRFLTSMPEKFEPEEEGPGIFNAVYIEADPSTGKALKIEKILKVIPL